MQAPLSVTQSPTTDTRAGELCLQGNELRRQGDLAGAESVLCEAHQLAPSHFPTLVSLAFLYRAEGRLRAAEDLLGSWMQKAPRDPHALIQIAGFLEEIQSYALALACLDEAHQRSPEAGQPGFMRGRILLRLGRTEEALESFETALTAPDTPHTAWLELAHARTFTAGDPLTGFFERALETPGLAEPTQASLHFALGKIRDDLGRWEDALTSIESANALRRRRSSYDLASHAEKLRLRLTTLRESWVAAPEPLPTEGPEPLFILGLPRSGTALLDRLLTAHPAIQSAGELATLSTLIRTTHLVERWRASGPREEAVRDAELEGIREVYRRTLVEAAGYPDPGVRYIVDRNPLNFFEVGVIRRLFPRAPIFALERDPHDVLLSLYFHDFEHPDLAFSYSIEAILLFIEGYQRLMSYWSEPSIAPMRTVRYATLVSEPAAVIPPLLRLLDLGPEDPLISRDLAAHRLELTETWLAGQPAFGRVHGHWKHYAAGLLARHPELARLGWTP